jgi:hypothetical protein
MGNSEEYSVYLHIAYYLRYLNIIAYTFTKILVDIKKPPLDKGGGFLCG